MGESTEGDFFGKGIDYVFAPELPELTRLIVGRVSGVYMPKVKIINKSAFEKRRLQYADFPMVEYIGSFAFDFCFFETINFPSLQHMDVHG